MAEAYPGIPTNEQWLFRQGELVLGPVNRDQLVQKLYAGEVTAQTPVTRLGENAFRPLSAVDGFGLHIAKAEAKLRVEAKSLRDQQASRRKKTVILSVVAAVAVVIAVGAAVGARYLAVHNPWADSDALAFADISMDPPTITLAKADPADEELLAYPLEPGTAARHSERARRTDHTASRTAAKGERAAPVPSKTATDSEGLQIAQADQGAINEVVVAHKKSLYPCLIAEARRKPGLAARIPIEFTVGNDGKVSKLWVDNPDFKDGPLPDCMLKTLRTWPFKPYAGAGASVGLSFTIGKRGG